MGTAPTRVSATFRIPFADYDGWRQWVNTYAITRWCLLPIVDQYERIDPTPTYDWSMVRFTGQIVVTPVGENHVDASCELDVWPEAIGVSKGAAADPLFTFPGASVVPGPPNVPPFDPDIIARSPFLAGYAHGSTGGSINTGGPVNMGFSNLTEVPRGWTVIFLVWTGDGSQVAVAEPNALTANSVSATQLGQSLESQNAGTPGSINWDHKWTAFYIEEFTGGELSSVSVSWPVAVDSQFTNGMHVVAMAAPPIERPSYGIVSPGRFTTSTSQVVGFGTRERYQLAVAMSTDGTQSEEGSITADTNVDGIVASGSLMPTGVQPPSPQVVYYAIYAPNGAPTTVTASLPGSNTGASYASAFVEPDEP